jgi:outer membrane protein OmpA-like peptidoglycan-associated protein
MAKPLDLATQNTKAGRRDNRRVVFRLGQQVQ